MKNIVITFSNGDTREYFINPSEVDETIKRLVDTSFKSSYIAKDEDGNLIQILNMAHVRSIEIAEDYLD